MACLLLYLFNKGPHAIRSELPVKKSILAIFMTSFCLAHADPLYLLWDAGTKKDKADKADVILDLNAGCAPAKPVNLPPVFVAKSLPKITLPTVAQTQATLNTFGLDLDAHMTQLVWVLESSKGAAGPVFILVPETHAGATKESVANDGSLHFSRTYYSSALVDQLQKSTRVLNLREGLAGENPKQKFSFKEKDALSRVVEMANKGMVDTFSVLATVFQKSPDVYSSYLEKSDLVSTDATIALGGIDGKKSADDVIKRVSKAFPKLDKEIARGVYTQISKMNKDQRRDYVKSICVSRGEQMAGTALALAGEKKAGVVFMTFSAPHYADIAAALRQAKVSYVTLVGRLVE